MTEFHYIIDNVGENTLAEVLNRNINSKSYCSVATAYFTVSGFRMVEQSLKKCTHFRLLLGAGRDINPLSITERNIWRNLDTQIHIRDMNSVLKFFSDRNVEVRLYPDRFLHAKAYILNHPEPIFRSPQKEETERAENEVVTSRQRPTAFYLKGKVDSDKSTVIVGSSNFTYGGLMQNAELNIIDPLGKSTTEVLTWFEELWRNSTDIKSDFIKLLRGYCEPFPPFLIYAKALWELYKEDLENTDIIKSTSIMELADFQTAGYKSAKRILGNWGGVLISDAPGLGKTYVAGKILEDFAYYNKEPSLIICPAEVEQIWEQFIKKYNIPVKQIIHTENLGHGVKDGTPKLSPLDYSNYSFILVDESHHFRNPRTGRYAWLQELISLPRPIIYANGKTKQVERKIVFLTATPVNNSVWDIYWQLKLIFGEKLPDIASGVAIKDIKLYFQSAENGKNSNIYDLVEYVTVRRSRLFLRQYYPNSMLNGKPIKFPKRIPFNLTYEWHPQMQNVYSDSTSAIYNCKLAPYRLEDYREGKKNKKELMRNELLSLLFRILLLKRLESSLWAFRKTLSNLIELFQTAASAYKNGYLVDVDTIRKYFSMLQSSTSDDNNSNELIEAMEFNRQELDINRIMLDLKHDIKNLKRIQESIPEDIHNLEKVDNKMLALKSELRSKPKKVLLFTAFRDTALYLSECMRTEQHIIGLVTGSESKIYEMGNETSVSRTEVVNRFSPKSNNISLDKENEINILISTDVLSESLNLQDSDSVINYDLPWNPMRLVQRTGRIDRIGSDHDEIKIYNIFPERGLEGILRLMEKLYAKISASHRSVGLEWSLLGEDPMPVDFSSTVQKLRQADKDEFDRLIMDLEKKTEGFVGLDPQEQLLAILQILPKEQIESIPDGAGSVTSLDKNEHPRKRGFFVSYRKRTNMGVADRIWRFFPINEDPIKNKTEILSLIQFPRSHKAEPRIEEENLEKLREVRLRIEREITNIAASRRTVRISGRIRKAFELVKKKGRADIDDFLQQNCRKPGVEQKLRMISYNDEQKAIYELESLLKMFSQKSNFDQVKEDQSDSNFLSSDDLTYSEVEQLSSDHDPSLELVCWMDIK